MPKSDDDIDWFRQTLRATFPYLVFCAVFILGTLVIVLWAQGEDLSGADGATPLNRAHSHNDYLHELPLEDALALEFGSVEADIHLVDGALLVAHDLDKVSPEKTLAALYLDPLWKRFQAQGGVYPTPRPFTLLIDIKSDGTETFEALQKELTRYATMLTHFTATAVEPGAVTVVISGNRDMAAILAAEPRLSGIDGRLSDLEGAYTAGQMPLISDNWTKHFKWRGKGEFPAAEAEKLQQLVDAAHKNGMKVRFWATPHEEALWQALYDAGVDLLNADDLPRLRALLLQQPAKS